MFNAVSMCTYGFTTDIVKAKEVWDKKEKLLLSEEKEVNKTEIEHLQKDFWNLDAQRYFIANSFDFKIKSVGVYENKDIVHKACSHLCSKFDRIASSLLENIIPIIESNSTRKYGYDSVIESTMQHSYDIILEGEDDTLGNILSYMMYQQYFVEDKELSYCSFKKFHPHDSYGVLRIAYRNPVEKTHIINHLKNVLMESKKVMEKIRAMMK